MTGKEVREVLLNNGVVLADLASSLGITAQTLNSRLNAKYFKDDYLNDISDITGVSFKSESPMNCDDLLRIIESQQKTIETLSRTIENITNNSKSV